MQIVDVVLDKRQEQTLRKRAKNFRRSTMRTYATAAHVRVPHM